MDNQDRRSSEPPKRLEELIEYFERGKSFTEELMKENERLRMRTLKLEHDRSEALSQLDQGTVQALQEENRRLREKVEALEARFEAIEQENQDFAYRYVEIQGQNDNLLNLYVSSYQLHSTLNPDEVVSVIQEIILNLIGADRYFVCMIDPKTQRPVITAGEGATGPLERKPLSDPDEILAGVLEEGNEYFRGEGEDGPHLACTPLKVHDRVVGAISIQKLMDQKKGGFSPIDHELLSLLADHAATALVSANLFSRTERKLKTVESFIELLKTSSVEMEDRQ